MEYEHAGPVAGGTFPAEIFHDFMTQWVSMRDFRRAARAAGRESEDDGTYVPDTTVDPGGVPEAEQAEPTTPSEAEDGAQPEASPQPDAPADPSVPETPVPVEPVPAPVTPPSGEGGSGGGGVAPGQP